jgi:hypothetical protein
MSNNSACHAHLDFFSTLYPLPASQPTSESSRPPVPHSPEEIWGEREGEKERERKGEERRGEREERRGEERRGEERRGEERREGGMNG